MEEDGCLYYLFAGFVLLAIAFACGAFDIKSKTKTTVIPALSVKPTVITLPQPARAPNPQPTDDNTCLRGDTATVVSVYTDDERDQVNSQVVFLTHDGLDVTCTFPDLYLDKLWKPGMRIRTDAGTRVVGTYEPLAPSVAKPVKPASASPVEYHH